jgi:hypothetical protein
VQLTNGKRSASVSSSVPTGLDKRRKVFVPKVSGPKNKGNNKITELRTILQRESQNS